MFQHPEDQIVTTVTEDDVAFGPENLAIEHDEIGLRISGSLDAVDMSDYRASDPTRMSGGQQQRIAIAGMLAMDSDVLVLDEPTAMLDPQGRADIMRVLDELQDRGTTIILVTHHADELEHADRVIQLEAGHIVGDGPADERLRMPVQSVGLPKRIDDEPAETLIEARDISYRYVDAERDVFNHLSFSIGKGETVALMGRNGAGKTTLARMLCALEKPTTGSIVIDGIAVATAKANGGTKPLNRKTVRGCAVRSATSCSIRNGSCSPTPWPKTSHTGLPTWDWIRPRRWNAPCRPCGCCISNICETVRRSTCRAASSDWWRSPA